MGSLLDTGKLTTTESPELFKMVVLSVEETNELAMDLALAEMFGHSMEKPMETRNLPEGVVAMTGDPSDPETWIFIYADHLG